MICGRANIILEALARSRGTLQDAATTISYPDMAAAVMQVIATLRARNVGATDCVAFACANDLPSSAVLLALLANGQTFILLPSSAPWPQPNDGAAPKTFCRYQIALQAGPGAPGTVLTALTNASVIVSENRCWRENPLGEPGRFLIPTSGSTGGAKLVRHRHDRLLRAAGQCVERLGLVAADRVCLPVPIAHMFGLGAGFLPALLAGASIDLQPQSNVVRYFARERHVGPTVAFLTPSFGDAIVRLRKSPRPYRLTVMAGDRLAADLFDHYERLHGTLVNIYGSSELGVIAAGDPRDPVANRRDVIGRLMPGAARCVPLDGEASPAEADILWLQHECGFECYVGADGYPLREPDGSLASSACFRSNDVGQVTNSYLKVLGRADDLVNRDGLLVACGDIAAAIRTLPAISDAIVLGGDMSRRGRALIAFCAPEAGGGELGALRRACLALLPPRAIPDRFVFLPKLPLLPSGKVDRMALRRHPDLDEAETDAASR